VWKEPCLKALSETVEDNGIPGRESIPGLLEYRMGCYLLFQHVHHLNRRKEKAGG
jgi:hypothetical protein